MPAILKSSTTNISKNKSKNSLHSQHLTLRIEYVHVDQNQDHGEYKAQTGLENDTE